MATIESAGPRVLETRFVASVAERDVDLVLLEELSVNPEFGEFLSSRVLEKPVFQALVGAWHSVAKADHGDGETDLLFVFQSEEGQRVALLIENKINAVAQPRQPERYRERGTKGVADGYWDAFQTVMVAPRRYLEGPGGLAARYDAALAYEEILSFFLSRRARDSRLAYKAKVILEAIEQNRRGYQPVISEAMTKFLAEYCTLADRRHPQLRVEDAKPRPAGSTWIQFRVPELPKGTTLYHQLTAGRVKLIWSGKAADEDRWRQEWAARVPPDVELETAGKSMAMSIAVPVIDPLGVSFAEQQKLVEDALRAAETLAQLVRSQP